MTLGYTPIKTEEPEVLLTFREHLSNARHHAGARETAKRALGSHTQKRSPGVRQISNYTRMSSV